MKPESRHLAEVRLACCGFNSISDSPHCIVSKSKSCGHLITSLQQALLGFLATTCLVVAAVEVVALLMAQFLAGAYKELKRPKLSENISGGPRMINSNAMSMSMPTSAPMPYDGTTSLPEGFRNTSPSTSGPASPIVTPGHVPSLRPSK